jgi:hypothetical protein
MQLFVVIVLSLVIRLLELTDWIEVEERLTGEVVDAHLE